MNLRFSLRALFGITAYVAACCPMFVSPNLWWGNLVLGATIVVFITTTRIEASQNRFWLGFSVTGWSWLALCFGFYAETATDEPYRAVRDWIYFAEYALSERFPPQPEVHYIHSLSGTEYGWGRDFVHYNYYRLVTCLSALFLGFLGGLMFRAFQRKPVLSS